MVEDALDRLSFLQDFGITYTVNSTDYVGIFDAEYIGVDAGDVIVNTNQSMFYVRSADIAAYVDTESGQWLGDSTDVTIDADIVSGDWSTQTGGYPLTANGKTYNVVDVQDDGTGMSTLILELQ